VSTCTPSSPSPAASLPLFSSFFFLNDPATTQIYTLSLHDALPISIHTTENRGVATSEDAHRCGGPIDRRPRRGVTRRRVTRGSRSEEHTSELQSLTNLVCRLLLEKKKTIVDTVSQPEGTST